MKKSILFLALMMLTVLGAQQAKAEFIDIGRFNWGDSYTLKQGDVLSGQKKDPETMVYLKIEKNATVTFRNLNLQGCFVDMGGDPFPSIECLGNAVIKLEGCNYVKGTETPQEVGGAAIFVPKGATLDILSVTGKDTLYAIGGDNCAAIGGSFSAACGNINILGGYIFAKAGRMGDVAAIGGGKSCGDIMITSPARVYTYCSMNAIGIGNSPDRTKSGDVIIDGTVYPDGIGGQFYRYPAWKEGDLSDLWGLRLTFKNGARLYGAISQYIDELTIEAGATITLDNADIATHPYRSMITYGGTEIPGLKCLGDAKIILKGKNKISPYSKFAGNFEQSGITIAEGATLTIQSEDKGELDIIGAKAPAIGGTGKCGNIVIEGGIIRAESAYKSAAIGAGQGGSCGDITIKGGELHVESSTYAAIGAEDGSCGNITIQGGTIYATGHPAIGAGEGSECGNITISDGYINATGSESDPAIGASGTCGNITISGGTIEAYGKGDGAVIGGTSHYCGLIVITDEVNSILVSRKGDLGCLIGKGQNGYCHGVTINGEDYGNCFGGKYYSYVLTCPEPTNVRVTDFSYDWATIAWDADESAEKFFVRYYSASTDTYYNEVETTSTTCKLTNLEPGEKYYVRVVSECKNEKTSDEYKATTVFRTKVYVPVPTTVKVSDVTNHAATIDWTPGDDKQDKWDVTLNDGFHDELFQVTKHPITLSNLVAETHYTIKVRGYDNGAKSEWSSEVTFNTDLDPDAEIYATIYGTTMTIYYDNKKSSRIGVSSKWTPGSGSISMGDAVLAAIKSVEIDASMQNAAPASLDHWFSNMSGLNSVTGMENLNTSRVTTMTGMFNECTSLTSLDLSSFNTASAVEINDMFSGCSNLQTLDLTNFTANKVSDMSFMFYQCSALTTIVCDYDWSTSLASSGSMFGGCSNLQGGRGTVYNSNETAKYYAHPDGGTANPGDFTSYKVDPEEIVAAKEELMQWMVLAMNIAEALNQAGEMTKAQQVLTLVDDAMNVYNNDQASLTEINAQISILENAATAYSAELLAFMKDGYAEYVQDLLKPGDSEACQKIVADAIAAIQAQNWYDDPSFLISFYTTIKILDGILQQAEADLEAQRKAEESTGIDNAQFTIHNVQCTKVISDGQLLILRGDKVYTVTGQEVK